MLWGQYASITKTLFHSFSERKPCNLKKYHSFLHLAYNYPCIPFVEINLTSTVTWILLVKMTLFVASRYTASLWSFGNSETARKWLGPHHSTNRATGSSWKDFFLLFPFHIFQATVFTSAASSSVNLPAQRETCNTGVVPMTLFTSCWVREQQTHTHTTHPLSNQSNNTGHTDTHKCTGYNTYPHGRMAEPLTTF